MGPALQVVRPEQMNLRLFRCREMVLPLCRHLGPRSYSSMGTGVAVVVLVDDQGRIDMQQAPRSIV